MRISELLTQIDIKYSEIQSLRGKIRDRIFEIAFEVVSGYEEYENKFYRYLKSPDWKENPEDLVWDLKRCLDKSSGDVVEIAVSDEWDTNYFRVPRKLIEDFLGKI